jgi:hypothetical protein
LPFSDDDALASLPDTVMFAPPSGSPAADVTRPEITACCAASGAASAAKAPPTSNPLMSRTRIVCLFVVRMSEEPNSVAGLGVYLSNPLTIRRRH